MPHAPNVIVFLTDQQRWDTVGAYGNPLGLTPCLDSLAARATLFTHAFTCQPLCGPARASLQTGRYASALGCDYNGLPLPDGTPTLAQAFGAGGYDSAYVGKWHLAGKANGPGAVRADRRGGYRHWLAADAPELVSKPNRCVLYDDADQPVELPGYRADATVDAAIRYLESAPMRPFFLFLSLLEPHQQNDEHRFVAPEGYAQRYAGRWLPPDLEALSQGSALADDLANYVGMVRRIDECLARLMQCLQRQGLRDNTILLFSSDHGCHFKTRAGQHKHTCHEASLRVPLVACGPGFEGGGRIDSLVSLVDVPATLLDAAGLPVPPSMQGGSLLPLVRGDAGGWSDDVLFETSLGKRRGKGLRTARWKYLAEADADPQGHPPRFEEFRATTLYDLAQDPWELVNLADDPRHAGEVAGLHARLARRGMADS